MEELKERLRTIEFNAKQRVAENSTKEDPNRKINRTAYVPKEPILIHSTEDIGTLRVRANHIDATIHYFMEQEYLKKNNAKIV